MFRVMYSSARIKPAWFFYDGEECQFDTKAAAMRFIETERRDNLNRGRFYRIVQIMVPFA